MFIGILALAAGLQFEGRVEPPARYSHAPVSGSACKGFSRSPARVVGDPIPIPAEEGDVPGPGGNEIRQIYSVSVLNRGRSHQTGWLFEAMDARLAYEDVSGNIGWGVLSIAPTRRITLREVAKWTAQLAQASGKRLNAEETMLFSSGASLLVVRPCFKSAWDGVSR